MKKITSSLYIVLFLTGMLTAGCEENSTEESMTGLSLKVYSPTVVMEGAEMTITGNRLEEVTAVVFPENTRVTTFDLITTNQIKLTIPGNIPAEGGVLTLLSENATVESPVSMRKASPYVRTIIPADEARIGQEITLAGTDLEYTRQAVFVSGEEETTIQAIDFVRKAAESIKLRVPEELNNGTYYIRLIAIDKSTLQTKEINIVSSGSDAGDTLWEGEFTIAGWDATLTLDIDVFATLAPNHTIRFHFTPNPEEGWWQIKVCDSNWAGFDGFDATGLENYPDGFADLSVTQEVYDRIMTDGIRIQGANYTLTKVELLTTN